MLRCDLPPAEEETPIEPSEPLEVIYVSMSKKDPYRYRLWLRRLPNRLMACVAIALLMTLVVSPDIYTTKTLAVPLTLLPAQVIVVDIQVIQTGIENYAATTASGTLTITNGGSLSQYIQAGFLLTSDSGIEVSTDYSTTVPAGNGERYGIVTVSAHAVTAGRSGNISAYDINRIYGTDIFIKNISAFVGGKDAYSVRYATDQDKQVALAKAKAQVEAKQPLVLLLKPCREDTSMDDKQATATLTCQPITYRVPAGIHVLGIRVQGMSVLLTYRALVNGNT